MIIIFIGKEFKYRNFLQNYILSKHQANQIYFFDSIDSNIDNIITSSSEVLIVVNEKLYSTIAKIIATLNNDTLELKDNYLIPSKTIVYEKNSFLTNIQDTLINVIKITDFIPEILLKKDFWTLHIFNYDLATAEMFIKPIFETFNINYTIYENEGKWCEVKFEKYNQKMIEQLQGFIPNLIVSNNIFEYLKELLESQDKKVTFAESCTGGLVASYLTKIPGSSHVFDGSVVSYANEIKHSWLGVDQKVLEKFGAVSEETIQQMLLGILEISDSDYAIAISGIAGPGGGSISKPVGTVFIGVGNKEGKFHVERHNFNGSREEIQYQTMLNSIRLLLNFMRNY